MNKWLFLAFAIFCFGLSFFVPLGLGLILVPLSTGMAGYYLGKYPPSLLRRPQKRPAKRDNATKL